MQYARTQRQLSYFETIVKIIVNSVGLVRFMECNQYQLWNANNYTRLMCRYLLVQTVINLFDSTLTLILIA